MDNNTDRNSAK